MGADPRPARPGEASRRAGVGMALVVTAALLWSTSGFLIKRMTLASIPLIGLRGGFAFAALAPLVRWRAVRLDGTLLVLALGVTGTQLLFVLATRWTTAANAIALQSTAPAWVFGLGWLATRRLAWPLLWPILTIVAGIAVMLSEPVHGTSLEGNLAGLLSGFTLAVTQISLKRIDQPAVGAVALSNLATLAACLPLEPGAFWAIAVPAWEWLALAYLGAIQIGLGFVVFTVGVSRITVGQASVLTLVEPLFNPVWVWLAIGEVPSAYGLAGFALILGGIVLDLWVRLRRPRGAFAGL